MRSTIAAVLLLALVAACGSGGSAAGHPTTTSTTSASTTTTAAPTTTTAAATTTTIVQQPQPSGEAAVDALLAAWRAGDRNYALVFADPPAVDALFAVAPEPGEARGCNANGANPTTYCVFRLSAGELQVRATPREGGYIVDLVILGS